MLTIGPDMTIYKRSGFYQLDQPPIWPGDEVVIQHVRQVSRDEEHDTGGDFGGGSSG
tara:strand:+ start:301 stop:471 length:171 start_codon:yes stop_codon:yes gene_type:complete